MNRTIIVFGDADTEEVLDGTGLSNEVVFAKVRYEVINCGLFGCEYETIIRVNH